MATAMATSARRRRCGGRAAAIAALAVLGTVDLAVAPAASAGSPAPARTCGPVAVEAIAPLPDERPWTAIERIAPPPAVHATDTVDMDGDQQADDVAGPTDGTLAVTRADGVLTLTAVPPSPPTPGHPGPYAQSVVGDDLDGDGRQELVLTQSYLAGFRLPYRYDTWIVPGTTPPGDATLAEVGLSIRGRLIGDIDADGRDDLLLQGFAMVGYQAPDTLVPGDQAMAGPDPTEVSPTAQRIGAHADLDLDGAVDQVLLGSPDGSRSAAIGLSSVGPIELAGGRADLVSLERSDVRTHLVLSDLAVAPFTVTTTTVATYRLRTTCAGAWMRSVVPLLAGRGPRSVDYPTFGPLDEPDLAARRLRTSTIVRSQTARGHLVDDAFAHYLGRPADPTGRAWWVAQLRAGRRTPERMFAELLGSPERFRRAGGDARTWVDATYPLVYGRPADPGGRAYWVRQVERLGPSRTAARMAAEPAARRRLAVRAVTDVDAFGPTAPDSAVTTAIATIDDLGFDAMLAELAASPELYVVANARHRLA